MPPDLPNEEISLRLLEHVEENPDTTQASMAAQLGVAIGSVNWYLKRLIGKGYIKVTRMQRRRLRYLLTPAGAREKARLAYEYMRVSLYMYRKLRTESAEILRKVRSRGYSEVVIDIDGDAGEIARLTALEMGVTVAERASGIPVLEANGIEYRVEWPSEVEA